jgi:hypothetical protein
MFMEFFLVRVLKCAKAEIFYFRGQISLIAGTLFSIFYEENPQVSLFV